MSTRITDKVKSTDCAHLDDVGGELVPHVDLKGVAAGGAARLDDALLLEDLEVSLRVLALLAQHKLLDEGVQHVLQVQQGLKPDENPGFEEGSLLESRLFFC